MSFTVVTVSHGFTNADGTTASGSVTFTLTGRMTNGTRTIVPADLTANLDASGNLSVSLYATDDVGTLPTDRQWRVDFRILGADPETFFVTVPHATTPVDLGTLLPGDQQVT